MSITGTPKVRDRRIQFADGPMPVTYDEQMAAGQVLAEAGVDTYGSITGGVAATHLVAALVEERQKISELETKLAAAESGAHRNCIPLEQHARQMAEFKKRVANKAMTLAREHDWCSVVQEALDDLGIEYDPPRLKGTIVVEFEIDTEITDATVQRMENGALLGFVRDSMRVGPSMQLDSDFGEAELTDWHIAEVRVDGDV